MVAVGTPVHDLPSHDGRPHVRGGRPATPAHGRISEAGVHYGDCAGVTLAVVLLPEPCGWENATPARTLASR
jgi:hypothetical protein